MTEERKRVQARSGGTIRVKQADGEAADIRKIVARWRKHRVPPIFTESEGRYGDFSNVDEYLDAHRRVAEARTQFECLPAAVRDLCANDPAELLRQVENPEQLELLMAAGLEPEYKPKTAVQAAPQATNPPAPEVTPPPAEPGPSAGG